jgi:hypothetical protein
MSHEAAVIELLSVAIGLKRGLAGQAEAAIVTAEGRMMQYVAGVAPKASRGTPRNNPNKAIFFSALNRFSARYIGRI